jgi:L-ascorbate metabolism protein UlaG (beta-lactamase superfamily)
MDGPTLQRLPRDATYVVPQGLGPWFRRAGKEKVFETDWWQTIEVGGVAITLVPAQHWSRRSVFDEDRSLWGGFVYAAGGLRVYHSGDTAYFSGFRQIGERLGPLDAALLPIGAYEPRWFMKGMHMNPADAVQAFIDLRARRFVAMHWGTFQLTDEPLDEPPRLLRALWQERGLPAQELLIPAIGETVPL